MGRNFSGAENRTNYQVMPVLMYISNRGLTVVPLLPATHLLSWASIHQSSCNAT